MIGRIRGKRGHRNNVKGLAQLNTIRRVRTRQSKSRKHGRVRGLHREEKHRGTIEGTATVT
jgi:hypothetical protein